jgi:putative FmdB family regulatory protein
MSKFILFDFRCLSCNNVFDDMVKPNVYEAPCPECGSSNVTRLMSAPRLDPRMGLDPEGNPTMGDKWAKIRKDRARQEKAHYEKHGTDMTPGADTSG